MKNDHMSKRVRHLSTPESLWHCFELGLCHHLKSGLVVFGKHDTIFFISFNKIVEGDNYLLLQVVFPKLESLELSYIHSEEILQHNQHRATSSFKLTGSRFQNLCQLRVKGSGNLKSLFSSSTATFMVHLVYLHIKDCKVMEEILLTEELGGEDIIPMVLFPRLESLYLNDLPILKRFCVGSNIKFPSLKVMVIEKCPKLESFIFKPVSSSMTASKELKEVISEEISHTALQPLFNEEVAIPNLKKLGLSRMENLKIIWHDQLAEGSFFKFQFLFVKHCENLVSIFESSMLTRLQSLERLEVLDCGSLQEVFELQSHDVKESHAVIAIPLKRLILRRLPKMKQVWNKDPQGIFSFQNLQVIRVWECESLKILFPASVARVLMQLEDLGIENCGVEEIISSEDVAEAAARFVFPNLTLLLLCNLPKLKWFYRQVHTSELPLLKQLKVTRCDQIEIFASIFSSFQETIERSELEPSIQQPLFLVQELAVPQQWMYGESWKIGFPQFQDHISRQANGSGVLLDDEELFHIAIKGLSKEYNAFRSAIRTRSTQLSFDELTIMLNVEEESLNEDMYFSMSLIFPSILFLRAPLHLQVLSLQRFSNLLYLRSSKQDSILGPYVTPTQSISISTHSTSSSPSFDIPQSSPTVPIALILCHLFPFP
uniref:Disease resistance protein At4g27190-like leucine-rich repeats domain-containing protein n=1 Tax=Quercus lobata TaxID=97700 RepID=A0A7N2L3Y1_QUELO